MFDTTLPITIPPSPWNAQAIEIRWPTDEEWATYIRDIKVITKQLGRGATEQEIIPTEAEDKLYQKIKQNGSGELTHGTAVMIINALCQCDVTDIEITGTEALVELQVPGGLVRHRLRVPTADEVYQMKRSQSRLIQLQYNRSYFKRYPEVTGKVWDTCGGKVEDSTGPVPLLHKDVVIRAVVAHIDQEVMVKRQDESDF